MICIHFSVAMNSMQSFCIKKFKWSLSKQGGILCCSFYYIKNKNKSFSCRVKKKMQSPDSAIALHSSDTKTVSL